MLSDKGLDLTRCERRCTLVGASFRRRRAYVGWASLRTKPRRCPYQPEIQGVEFVLRRAILSVDQPVLHPNTLCNDVGGASRSDPMATAVRYCQKLCYRGRAAQVGIISITQCVAYLEPTTN